MRTEAIDRVRLVFSLFDANGNGWLDVDDFELMARRVVLAAPEAGEPAKKAMTAAFRRYWATLASELDVDSDGRVTLDEYVDRVLSPERFDGTIADFAESLAALGDPDGDGLVERPAFMALMAAIGFDRANINSLFDAFSPSETDQIEAAVWAAGIKDYYSPDMTAIPGDHLVGSARV
jgi:Ca2+-binding EF-hand superfamily protein